MLRKGDLLYVHGDKGLQAIDISDPLNPALVGTRAAPGDRIVSAVFFGGGILFAGSRVGFISLDNPRQPVLGPVRTLDFLAFGVTAHRDLVYVSDFKFGDPPGLLIFDFSDGMSFMPVANLERPVTENLLVSNGQLVVCGNSELRLLDLLDTESPVEVASVASEGRLCHLVGNLIFTVGQVVEIGPRSLRVIGDFVPLSMPVTGLPHGSASGREFVLQGLSGGASLLRTPARMVFPQYVDGRAGADVNRSRVVIRNDSQEWLEGVARFYSANGEEVNIGGQPVTASPFVVEPGGVVQIATEGSGDLKSGVAEIRFQQASSPAISGSLIFELLGRFVSVPPSPPLTQTAIFATSSDLEGTGTAAYNSDPAAGRTLEVRLRDSSGVSMAQDSVVLEMRERRAFFLDELPNIGAFLAMSGDFVGTASVTVAGDRKAVVLGLVQRLSDGALFSVSNQGTENGVIEIY